MPEPPRARGPYRRVVMGAGLAVFVIAFGTSIALDGLPWSRDRLAMWVFAALFLASLADLQRWFRGMLVDWLPLFGLLFLYDLLRGSADEFLGTAHVYPQMRFDEVLFGGTVPTVRLQDAFYDPAQPHWWDIAAWLVYTSHFFVPLGIAVALWLASRVAFRRYAAMFVLLTLAGFLTYALLPAVPPWLASELGYLDPTTRLVPQLWIHVGVEPAAMIFQGGNEYANDIAALPSLHAAYPLLLALCLWPRGSSRWRHPLRAALVAYPLVMALALVYGAEHYVADIVMGWGYAALAFAAVEAVRRRLAARRAHRLSARLPVPDQGV